MEEEEEGIIWMLLEAMAQQKLEEKSGFLGIDDLILLVLYICKVFQGIALWL